MRLIAKGVHIQDFRFDINTDTFILIPIDKFYPTNIINLTNTSFLLTDISIND